MHISCLMGRGEYRLVPSDDIILCVVIHPNYFIKLRRMRECYYSVCVCVCVCVRERESTCLSVTALVATYLGYVSKVRRHTVPCRLLKICTV